MPGFIQSLKSRLPQSPFSPPKQSSPVLPSVESTESAEVTHQPEEQPSAEVLPAEALLAPNSSTVALTLTPANGQLSQQLTTQNDDAAEPVLEFPEELTPIPQASAEAATCEAGEVFNLPEVEPPVAVSSDAGTDAPTIAPVAEGLAQKCSAPPLPPSETPLATPESLLAANLSDLPTTTESFKNTQQPTIEPVTCSENAKPASIRSTESITSKTPSDDNSAEIAAVEATSVDEATAVALPILQVQGTIPEAQPVVQPSTLEVKEVKQQKKRFGISPLKSFSSNNSQDGQSTDDSAHAKPKKNQALAGRFRHVIGQVKSKVKKDKDTQKTPNEPHSDNPSLSDDGVSSGKLTPSDNYVASEIAVPVDAAVAAETASTV